MDRQPRRLGLSFADAETFQLEYRTNLARGGVFVPTRESFALRELVEVELHLAYSGHRVVFAGEVVHLVPPELAASGATPGVALELQGSQDEIGARLAPLAAYEAVAEEAMEPERRGAPRFEARLTASIDANEDSVDGHTRNLSPSGVLVSVAGKELPVGDRVVLSLQDPGSGERIEVQGRVARVVRSGEGGGASGMAVEFEPEREQRHSVQRFVAGVQRSEHARRLGGITGSIEEIGLANLISMLGRSSPAGTLSVRLEGGEEEGLLGFEGALLRYVCCGPVCGVKALARLLLWERGRFEFHARLDPAPNPEPPLPLEAALLEAMRQVDELGRVDRRGLEPERQPRVAGEPGGALSKLEAAVLDLARVGDPLGRLLDVIPEPDAAVYAALRSLVDQGVVSLD